MTRAYLPVMNIPASAFCFVFLFLAFDWATAQSPLRKCPELGLRHECEATDVLPNGERFVGTFREGFRSGLGTYFWPDGTIYSGEFQRDKRHGVGQILYADGRKYIGEWRNNTRSGLGIEYRPDGTVDRSGRWDGGDFRVSHTVDSSQFSSRLSLNPASTSRPAPQGTPSDRFVADRDGRRMGGLVQPQGVTSDSGVGFLSSTLPACPETQTLHDKRHNCVGVSHSSSGATYRGEFRDNRYSGRGVLTYRDGSRYVGEWADSLRSGEGVEFGSTGAISFSGRWANGQLIASYPVDLARLSLGKAGGVVPPPQQPQTSHEPTAVERDKLLAEVEAERLKRLHAEQKLAEREKASADLQRPAQPAVNRFERRVALLIGNSAYRISPLENPANDAADMDAALRRAGFQTTLVRNATLAQIREATRRFADQLPSSDVALIYFAGHGIESNRKNYLIPVNADLKFEYELSEQAYDASVWLEMLESVKSRNADRVNIVILDACRNNTLIGSRSLGRGLGRMDAPTGTFLAYSTAPGKVAADGGRGERNSPFTRHLLRAMRQPGLPIEEVFKEVRRNVSRETGGAQVPWESTSLTGHFSFQAR